LPSFFLNWPNFLDVLAGNFFGSWQHCPEGDLFTAGQAGTAKPRCLPAGRTGPAGSEEILSSVARWQNFRPKSSKGAIEKKFVAEFWLILPKTGRKGAAENFQKKFLIFSCDNHV